MAQPGLIKHDVLIICSVMIQNWGSGRIYNQAESCPKYRPAARSRQSCRKMINPATKCSLADLQVAVNTFSDLEKTQLLVLHHFKLLLEIVFSLNNYWHLAFFFFPTF